MPKKKRKEMSVNDIISKVIYSVISLYVLYLVIQALGSENPEFLKAISGVFVVAVGFVIYAIRNAKKNAKF